MAEFSPPIEDHIILQFGVMRLSCDRGDIYVRSIWIRGENPSAEKKKPVNPLKPSFCFCHCDEPSAPLIVIPPLILLLSSQTGEGLLALQVQTDEGVTERGAPKPGRHPLLQPCVPGDL